MDSYDYTVEQHVLGSLLFTPLLLLLPTTSAFYSFFTILISSVSFICVVVKVSIYVIHATPYNKILLWLVKKRRFPAGIWFEFICYQHNAAGSAAIGAVDLVGTSSSKSSKSRGGSSNSDVLVSFMHSNYLNAGMASSVMLLTYAAFSYVCHGILELETLSNKRDYLPDHQFTGNPRVIILGYDNIICKLTCGKYVSGELVQSSYEYIHSLICRSSFASSAYGVITGKR